MTPRADASKLAFRRGAYDCSNAPLPTSAETVGGVGKELCDRFRAEHRRDATPEAIAAYYANLVGAGRELLLGLGRALGLGGARDYGGLGLLPRSRRGRRGRRWSGRLVSDFDGSCLRCLGLRGLDLRALRGHRGRAGRAGGRRIRPRIARAPFVTKFVEYMYRRPRRSAMLGSSTSAA